jgi:hypothetical protein
MRVKKDGVEARICDAIVVIRRPITDDRNWIKCENAPTVKVDGRELCDACNRLRKVKRVIFPFTIDEGGDED